MKIRYKLYILFLLLAVVPLAVIGYISYVNAKQAILQQQRASLESIVESRVFDVEILIELRKEQARLISGNYVPRQIQPDGTIPADFLEVIQGHIESTLTGLQERFIENDRARRFARSFIERIELADLNGRIVASTDRGRIGIFYDEHLINRLPEEGTFFGGYRMDETTGRNHLTIVSDLIHYETGELSGAVILSVHPGILQEIAGNEPGLKYTGEMLIIDFGDPSAETARVIAGMRNEYSPGLAIDIDVAAFDNPEFLLDTHRDGLTMDHHGEPVLAVSRQLPEMNWAVVGKINTAEVLEPVNAFLYRLLLGVIVLSLLSLILAYFISSSAAGLIEKLNQTFSRLSRGKLSDPLAVSRKDEFGDLAQSANQTAEYLKKKIEDANRIASGSYREEVHRAGEDDKLGAALQVMTDSLEQNRQEITELLNRLRAANEELTENQARLQAVFETSADAILTIVKGNQIEEVNEAAVRMFGFTRDELASKMIQDILPAMGQPVEQLLNNSEDETGAVSRPCIGIRKDESTFPVGCSCSLAEWGNQKIVSAIVRDLTYERKLERNMLDAGLKERSKIGHEIHEGLGQTLTGLHFIAGQIARRLTKENHPVADELEQVTESIREADRHAQQLFQELVIVEHAMGGLVRSFQLLSEIPNGNGSCKILVEADEEFRCENNTAGVHLFHIVKDGVDHAIDQDNPDRIQIICSKDGRTSSLTIQYKAVSRSESESRAISDLMKYRSNLLGGTITSEFNDENDLLKVECRIPTSVLMEKT